MDEYIRADNDFHQRREEAYRFSEMTRGFGGRIHPRHVRSIHSTQSDDRGSQQQRPQYSSQASGQQQSYLRPPAPRGRGARGFEERFGDQPRKIYCLFCGEDKGHTTRMCHVTIQKQNEIAEAAAQQNQPKQVMHTASYHSPYIPEYVGNHPAVSVASASRIGTMATASTSATTTTCIFTKPEDRREPTDPSTARLQGGVQSSYSQQYCARIEAYLLRDILPLEQFLHSLPFPFLIRNNY
jgi:hypothetical protein